MFLNSKFIYTYSMQKSFPCQKSQTNIGHKLIYQGLFNHTENKVKLFTLWKNSLVNPFCSWTFFMRVAEFTQCAPIKMLKWLLWFMMNDSYGMNKYLILKMKRIPNSAWVDQKKLLKRILYSINFDWSSTTFGSRSEKLKLICIHLQMPVDKWRLYGSEE